MSVGRIIHVLLQLQAPSSPLISSHAESSPSRVRADLLDVVLDGEVVPPARLQALDGRRRAVGQNDALALRLELSLAGEEAR